MDLVKLKQLANETALTLRGYAKDPDDWVVAKKTKDATIEYKRSACPGFERGYLYRGESEFDTTKEVIYSYLELSKGNDSLRMRWDKNLKSVELLKVVDENTKIINTISHSAAMGLISPRDYVDMLTTTRTPEFISITARSVDLKEFENKSDRVRGWNYPCGVMCISCPNKSNCTKVLTFNQTDIKGSLPKSVVDAALPNAMISFYTNLRGILKKDGHIKA